MNDGCDWREAGQGYCDGDEGAGAGDADYAADGEVGAKNKEIDKREALTDAEEQSILTTLLKQRRESVEQFTKGNRPELAAKEQVEIGLIEGYMPKALSEDDLRALVAGAVEQVTAENGGTKPGPKEMGSVMKAAQAKIAASGARADGKLVSELVKAELAKA